MLRCHGYCVNSEKDSTLFQNRVNRGSIYTKRPCRRRIRIHLLLFPIMWKEKDLFSYDPITWIMADRLLCRTGQYRNISFDLFRWLAVATCPYCVLAINSTLDPVFVKGK